MTQSLLPRLTPHISEWMRAALNDRPMLATLFEEYGSPLNLHHLQPFGDNYRAYAEVMEQHKLRHLIFFARKANKCVGFVQEAERLGFGVDTASYRELKQCLDNGCHPDRLVLTAAIKNEALVHLAVSHDVLIVVDNRDECALVNAVAHKLGKKPAVGVRIGGFEVDGERLYTRFGFPVIEAVDFVGQELEENYEQLRFAGFHFHLNGYSPRERGAALVETVQCAAALRERGIETQFIDMGGGLLMNYLRDKGQWEAFMRALKQAVQGERPPVTFGNNSLGLQVVDGQVYGEPSVYPYYNELAGPDFLAEVLTYQGGDGQTAAQLLREYDIQLRMEPGRSMLNQTGMTVAKVAFRKWDSREDLLVGLEMNRSQLFSSSADFLLDPLMVYHEKETVAALPPEVGTAEGYFVGAYCLEQDIVLKRKLPFAHIPEIGDWVAFPNTAGYMMHFYETEAHLFELATNLMTRDAPEEGRMRFVLDGE